MIRFALSLIAVACLTTAASAQTCYGPNCHQVVRMSCPNGQCQQQWQPTGQTVYRHSPVRWGRVLFPRISEFHRQRSVVYPYRVEQYQPPAYQVQPPMQYRIVR